VASLKGSRHDEPVPAGLSRAVEAYAAYLNAPRGILDSDEQMLFDEDMARARAAMERAWLEATPVQDDTPPAPPGVPWFRAWLRPITRAARRALVRA
jgi:hypothetical protein